MFCHVWAIFIQPHNEFALFLNLEGLWFKTCFFGSSGEAVGALKFSQGLFWEKGKRNEIEGNLYKTLWLLITAFFELKLCYVFSFMHLASHSASIYADAYCILRMVKSFYFFLYCIKHQYQLGFRKLEQFHRFIIYF